MVSSNRSWFPFTIGALTLLLFLFVLLFYYGGLDINKLLPGYQISQGTVSSIEYKNSLKTELYELDAAFARAVDNTERVSTIRESRNTILDILVPAEYRDLHLEVAIVLSLLEQGYDGDDTRLEEGNRRLGSLYYQYEWLSFD